MWIKQIKIKTGTAYPEGLDKEFIDQITNEFSMYATPFTTNVQLLNKARSICHCNDDQNTLVERFRIIYKGHYYSLNSSGRLIKLIRFLGNPNTLYLDYTIGIPGGLGTEKKNGIHYFLHTKELRHVPHVHARYQGEEISIEILTSKVKGSFKNHKKLKEAVEHIKCNRADFLEKYNMYTNGIHIETEYVNDGTSTDK